ncbi:MAG: DUF3592 domain-containing protein [Xanthomonadales bacterium]|nr:DUF3592 domain-containing protein [Xanthomonadales bacterium]
MIAFLFLLVSLALFGGALRALFATHRMLRSAVRTTGRIRAFVETRDSDGDKVMHALIDFEADGEHRTIETGGMRAHPVGAIVPVVYVPGDPSQDEPLPDIHVYTWPACFLCIALAGIVCSLGTLFEASLFRFFFPALY